MDWVKLFCDFEGHPKVLSVGLSGAGLYTRSLAYCGKYETDGFVPKAWVQQALANDKQVLGIEQVLVNAGLWEENENGYEIPAFIERNRSHKEMEKLRQNRSRAGKKGGLAKRQANAKAKAKQNGSKSPSYSFSSSSSSKQLASKPKALEQELGEWLDHYRATTGNAALRGSKAAATAFAARRKDGYSVADLKLATVGCHSDDFCRKNGHDVPETILRASKVTRYIELGRRKEEQPASKYAGLAKMMAAEE